MNLKNILTSVIIAGSGLVHSASAGNTPSQLGDLILGFRATSGLGINSYVIANLGPASTVRDALTNINLFSGTALKSALDANFGTSWATRTDVWVGAAMGFEDDEFGPHGAGVGLNGDPFLTIYASNKRTAVGTAGTASSAAWNPTPNSTIGASTGMLDSANVFITAAAGVATIANTSSALDWDNRNPFSGNTPGLAFNTFAGGVQSAFAAGTAGNLAGYDAEAMLDLYRIESDTVSTVGTSFEGTIVIDSEGLVNFVAAVPEPSTLCLFAIGTGLAVLRRRRSTPLRAQA